MRINKYLTTANYCSRREADRLIEAGKVKLNGKRAKLGDQVEEGDRVEVPGQVIELEAEPVYLAFNKPVGVITTSDPNSRNNIINAVNSPVRVYPVGRLDVATSGLIIMTNDGELVNRVLKAENKIEKEYLVEVDQKLTPEFLEAMRHGMNIGSRKKTLPAKVEKINDRQFSITIVEGRKRQVRRMCERGGYEVKGLTRVRIGGLKLGNLLPSKTKKISKNKIYFLLGL
jgi:23S rRNA pseudouridine2604 synthase